MRTLTDVTIKIIAQAVAGGATFAEACRQARVNPEVGREWLARGRGRRSRPANGLYLKLAQAVQEAEQSRGLVNVDSLTSPQRHPAPVIDPSPAATGEEPTDPTLLVREAPFARLFAAFLPEPSWRPWWSFLCGLFGLPMDPDTLATYQKHTGRQTAPSTAAREAWVVAGRRGGKSRIAAFVATWLSLQRYRTAPGERPVVAVIASDRPQARVIFGYIRAFFETPALAQLVVGKTAHSLTLSTGLVIEVHTRSFRTVRGYTIVAALLDEVAYWQGEDSANPDTEVIAALKPGMLTIPNALLLGISSPYARRGVLWDAYSQHFGKEGDPVLVWQADTLAMNCTADAQEIRKAYEADPIAAASEFGAEFRTDVERFLSLEALARATVPGRTVLPPSPHLRYLAFCDPSGGASDSFTLAIAHRALDTVEPIAVLDHLVERRPPFNPSEVVGEFAGILRQYGISRVTGDYYSGEWCGEAFRKERITYEVSERTKSELYLELLPLISSRGVQLLDHRRLHVQFQSLERTTGRSGKDSVSHPPGGHDDLANSVAGALVLAVKGKLRPLAGTPAALAGITRVGRPTGIGAGDLVVTRKEGGVPFGAGGGGDLGKILRDAATR